MNLKDTRSIDTSIFFPSAFLLCPGFDSVQLLFVCSV